jgi:xanthine dehydrogenase accessory factor
MVCGGDVTVWFQPVRAAQADWSPLAGALLARLAARQPGWLVLRLDGSLPSLLSETGAPLAGAPADELSLSAVSGFLLTDALFAMPLPVRDRAVLFGAGHCARALVPVLSQVGFSVTVMDDRPEYADPALLPQADQVICGDYLRIAETLTLLPSDYVVVMTSGHRHDFEVQTQVLRNPPVYVGVIGSRSKRAFVDARLRDAGIAPDVIRQVHSPVGTAIQAVTPEEIAVSIAGEMIEQRALLRQAKGAPRHSCPMHEG